MSNDNVNRDWNVETSTPRSAKPCQGTHYLKVGACASSQLRFSQKVHRLTVAPL